MSKLGWWLVYQEVLFSSSDSAPRSRAPLTPPFYLQDNIYTRGTAHRALEECQLAPAVQRHDVQFATGACTTVTHTTVTVIGCDERMTAACPSPLSERQRFAFAQRSPRPPTRERSEYRI